ncbi:unnamed protein product [Darwinula stevensoni]|uniref:Uncharacterized protein n=1 Tax=Darwinula stevensoni TaxID=69355 RepID=A0A7R9A2E1_9CRUS|nr:unnamed protein product [Darwinula stevensoni]CAG0888547.1 unnamed protein product [Darwinula stevensoni]
MVVQAELPSHYEAAPKASPLAYGVTTALHIPMEEDTIRFNPNEKVLILSKPVPGEETSRRVLGIEVNGKRGYAPLQLIREISVMKKTFVTVEIEPFMRKPASAKSLHHSSQKRKFEEVLNAARGLGITPAPDQSKEKVPSLSPSPVEDNASHMTVGPDFSTHIHPKDVESAKYVVIDGTTVAADMIEENISEDEEEGERTMEMPHITVMPEQVPFITRVMSSATEDEHAPSSIDSSTMYSDDSESENEMDNDLLRSSFQRVKTKYNWSKKPEISNDQGRGDNVDTDKESEKENNEEFGEDEEEEGEDDAAEDQDTEADYLESEEAGRENKGDGLEDNINPVVSELGEVINNDGTQNEKKEESELVKEKTGEVDVLVDVGKEDMDPVVSIKVLEAAAVKEKEESFISKSSFPEGEDNQEIQEENHRIASTGQQQILANSGVETDHEQGKKDVHEDTGSEGQKNQESNSGARVNPEIPYDKVKEVEYEASQDGKEESQVSPQSEGKHSHFVAAEGNSKGLDMVSGVFPNQTEDPNIIEFEELGGEREEPDGLNPTPKEEVGSQGFMSIALSLMSSLISPVASEDMVTSSIYGSSEPQESSLSPHVDEVHESVEIRVDKPLSESAGISHPAEDSGSRDNEPLSMSGFEGTHDQPLMLENTESSFAAGKESVNVAPIESHTHNEDVNLPPKVVDNIITEETVMPDRREDPKEPASETHEMFWENAKAALLEIQESILDLTYPCVEYIKVIFLPLWPYIAQVVPAEFLSAASVGTSIVALYLFFTSITFFIMKFSIQNRSIQKQLLLIASQYGEVVTQQNSLEEENDTVRLELQRERKCHLQATSRIASMEEQLEETKKLSQQKEEKLVELAAEKEKLQDAYSDLQQQFELIQGKFSTLIEDSFHSQKSVDDMKDQVQWLEEEFQKKTSMFNALQEQFQALGSEEKDKLEQELTEAQVKIDDSSIEVVTLRKLLTDIEGMSGNNAADFLLEILNLGKLERKLKQLGEERDALKEQVSELAFVNDKIREQADIISELMEKEKHSQVLDAFYKKRETDLLAEVTRLKMKEEKFLAMEADGKTLGDRIESLEETIKLVAAERDQAARTQNEIALQADREILDMKRQIIVIQKRLNAAMAENADLRQRLTTLGELQRNSATSSLAGDLDSLTFENFNEEIPDGGPVPGFFSALSHPFPTEHIPPARLPPPPPPLPHPLGGTYFLAKERPPSSGYRATGRNSRRLKSSMYGDSSGESDSLSPPPSSSRHSRQSRRSRSPSPESEPKRWMDHARHCPPRYYQRHQCGSRSPSPPYGRGRRQGTRSPSPPMSHRSSRYSVSPSPPLSRSHSPSPSRGEPSVSSSPFPHSANHHPGPRSHLRRSKGKTSTAHKEDEEGHGEEEPIHGQNGTQNFPIPV